MGSVLDFCDGDETHSKGKREGRNGQEGGKMMDYQKILEFVAPLDAFVLQHRYLAAVFRGVFLILVISACAKKYGAWLDPDNDLKEFGFLTGQAEKEWKNWKKYRN